MWILVLQRMILEFVLDILYFPIWWYSRGLFLAFNFCLNWIKDANLILSPALWLKNIFVPMFGQWDWQGRIMSFFMRLANVIIRTIMLWIWILVVLVVFLLWSAFPIFVGYMLSQFLI